MTSPGAGLRFARAALARVRSEQRGITVVEGIVAALLLVVGALAALQAVDASTRNSFRAEQSQVVNNRLQAELERIKQLPYAKIALTQYPTDSASSNDPRWRVAGTRFAVDREGASDSQRELVVNGSSTPDGAGTVSGGIVDPEPEPFSTGDVGGEIYRFVTWAGADCPDCEGAMKRVIVAAKVDDAAISFERAFQELHTDVPDPEARPDPNPGPPGEEQPGNTAELWLTDTPCDQAARLRPQVPHLAHNTLGRCAQGGKTGNDPGAPDLMFTEGPPAVDPALDPPLEDFDLATDVGGSEDEIGLTMPSASTSCLLEPVFSLLDIRKLLDGLLGPLLNANKPGPLDGVLDLVGLGANRHLRIHKWVSPKVTGSGGVLVGDGTLDLWTRTVNGTSHPGEICASLFIRQTVQVPVCPLLGLCLPGLITHVALEVDVPVVNVGLLTNQNGLVCQQGLNLTYFRCSMSQWPSEWSKVSMPMKFVGVNAAGQVIPLVLPPSSQVGLALMVRKSGTDPGQGLELMYDHADFESRLQLKTESLICFGNCSLE